MRVSRSSYAPKYSPRFLAKASKPRRIHPAPRLQELPKLRTEDRFTVEYDNRVSRALGSRFHRVPKRSVESDVMTVFYLSLEQLVCKGLVQWVKGGHIEINLSDMERRLSQIVDEATHASLLSGQRRAGLQLGHEFVPVSHDGAIFGEQGEILFGLVVLLVKNRDPKNDDQAETLSTHANNYFRAEVFPRLQSYHGHSKDFEKN